MPRREATATLFRHCQVPHTKRDEPRSALLILRFGVDYPQVLDAGVGLDVAEVPVPVPLVHAGVLGNSCPITGCVKAANQSSVIAGTSSAVAGSSTRGLVVVPILDGVLACLNACRVVSCLLKCIAEGYWHEQKDRTGTPRKGGGGGCD
jgi:hypothetical protein